MNYPVLLTDKLCNMLLQDLEMTYVAILHGLHEISFFGRVLLQVCPKLLVGGMLKSTRSFVSALLL